MRISPASFTNLLSNVEVLFSSYTSLGIYWTLCELIEFALYPLHMIYSTILHTKFHNGYKWSTSQPYIHSNRTLNSIEEAPHTFAYAHSGTQDKAPQHWEDESEQTTATKKCNETETASKLRKKHTACKEFRCINSHRVTMKIIRRLLAKTEIIKWV